MMNRCHNPRDDGYPRYGARGIAVCEWWRIFANFLGDMGERPEGKTIDRIDNGRGYEQGNCRWATPKEQAANKSHGSLKKTHCPQGHPYSPENTFINNKGFRRCYACSQARWNERYRRKKRQDL